MKSSKTWVRKIRISSTSAFFFMIFALSSQAQGVAGLPGAKANVYAPLIERCDVITPEKCASLRLFVEETNRSRKPIVMRLKESKDMEIRAKMAEALGYVGGEGVREALIEAIESNYSAGVKFAAVLSLGRLGDPLALPELEGYLNSEDVSLRIAAATSLGHSRLPSAIPALIEALGHYHPKSKASVLDALAAIGLTTPASTTAILNIMGDTSLPWTVHYRALNTVEKLTLKEAGPLVLGFLTHRRKEVVWGACRALKKLNLKYTRFALIHLAESLTHGGGAALALAEIGGPNVVKTLNWVAMNPELTMEVRRQVFRSLALLKDPRSVQPLVTVLKTKRQDLILLCLETLGQLGHPSAGFGIRPLLEHSEDEVRHHAEWAMQEISGKRFGDRLEDWDEWLKSLETPR